jgi:hypothetical protein
MTKLTDAFQLRPWTLEDKGKHFFKENQRINRIEEDDDTQVYKKPWVGLTEEEIDDIYWQHKNHCGDYEVSIWPYERAIEAKLKEKNT